MTNLPIRSARLMEKWANWREVSSGEFNALFPYTFLVEPKYISWVDDDGIVSYWRPDSDLNDLRELELAMPEELQSKYIQRLYADLPDPGGRMTLENYLEMARKRDWQIRTADPETCCRIICELGEEI